MQICCSTHSVILNVMATQYTCSLNSTSFTHMHSSPLSLAARLQQPCKPMSCKPFCYINNAGFSPDRPHMIASSMYEDCFLNTITVLSHLAKRGYKVLPHKAPICKQKVAYLGFQQKQGTGSWMVDRKQAIVTLKITEN